jgi:hypothetical protein
MADPFDSPEPSHETHGKKGSGLNAKMAGAPVWVWGVGGAGLLLVIILYMRSRSASASTATAAGTAATAGTSLAYDDPNQIDPNTGETYAQEGYTTPSAVDAYLAGSTGGATAPVGLTPQGLPAPTTNTQWASLVADYLVGLGDDPTLVTNALSDYTQGNPLSVAEQDIINTALEVFGQPPGGVIPITATPTTPVTTTPPATNPTSPTTPSGPAALGTVTVPVTFGQRAETAITMIQSAGLSVSTSPVRNPLETYESVGSSPEGGSKVAAGSHVTLNVKQKTY